MRRSQHRLFLLQVKQTEFTIRGGTLERYNGSATEVTIPDGVTYIGDEAFKDCRGIKSVAIPKTVVGIGNKAFFNCSSLSDIELPNIVTDIGWEAFRGCASLKSINIPNSVKLIDHGAFADCTSLVNVVISVNLQKFIPYIFIDPQNKWMDSRTPWYINSQKGFISSKLCRHCGGKFKGYFKRCSVCGRPKDYGWDKWNG